MLDKFFEPFMIGVFATVGISALISLFIKVRSLPIPKLSKKQKMNTSAFLHDLAKVALGTFFLKEVLDGSFTKVDIESFNSIHYIEIVFLIMAAGIFLLRYMWIKNSHETKHIEGEEKQKS